MTKDEKAKIILESMDEYGILINWNLEKTYIKAIKKGLEKIGNESK